MLLRLASRLRSDERGLGMLLVIGTATVVMALVIIGGTMATRALVNSRTHVSFESAIAVAEDGIDQALARAQITYQVSGSDDYTYPSSTNTCASYSGISWTSSNAPDGTAAPGSYASVTAGLAVERAWAKSWLTTLAQTASCRVHSAEGDYVFFKPSGHQTIYAMGWAPGYGRSDAKMRYLKNEYLFTPYAPTNAILTSGDLEIDSSTTVTSAPPNNPALASVHSNGVINVQGQPTVYGTVSQTSTGSLGTSNKFQSNTCAAGATGCVPGQVQVTPKQAVLFPGARSVWAAQHASTKIAGGWYDLCADGTVQSPTGTAPCTGSVIASLAGGGSYRGWSYTAPASAGAPPTWTAGKSIMINGYSGTYYIDGGNAVDAGSNAGSPVPNMTIIAAAQATAANPTGLACNPSKVGGNISWNLIDLAAPSVPSTFMLADQDILTTSNFTAGSASGGAVISGFFIAGDQISMQTSSAGAYGAVIAADQCNPSGSLVSSNVVKNPTIYYDPTAAAPFVDIVNTTLWLEYAG